MFDYNEQIEAYHDTKVNLPEEIREKLRGHRKANQDRLMENIRDGISVSRSSFVKQGSYAMRTTIQHEENDYDIDDGVVFKKEELVGERDAEMTPLQVRDMVLDAVSKNHPFKTKPERLKNCVRVFYEEGHHVDIPSYRKSTDAAGNDVVEHAGAEWKKSNPKEINEWFEGQVSAWEKRKEGTGNQLRRMVRLLKRFARSRESWNMPSGLILTMLVGEKFQAFDRDDECFRSLLQNLKYRLAGNLVVENLADSGFPREKLTKTNEDANMKELREKVGEALDKLAVLDKADCTLEQARAAWDWVFQSNGFFEAYDKDHEKAVALYANAALVQAGLASTSPAGHIGTVGVANIGHRFYGETLDTKR
jgi:hypothetical protein